MAGILVELVDTAGLRESQDAVERIGVERARLAAQEADAVLYVFDAAAGWTVEDASALARLDGKPRLIVANKADTVTSRPVLPAGALSLVGVAPEAGQTLRSLLSGTLASCVQTDATSEVLSSVRQRDLVERARLEATGAIEALSRGESPEYAATHLDAAIAALADVVGETTTEDVLGRIFSSFCIGK